MKSKHFSAKFIKLKLLVVLLDTSLIYFWGELGLSYTSGLNLAAGLGPFLALFCYICLF